MTEWISTYYEQIALFQTLDRALLILAAVTFAVAMYALLTRKSKKKPKNGKKV